jgi:PTS system mannitol-specific IIC component
MSNDRGPFAFGRAAGHHQFGRHMRLRSWLQQFGAFLAGMVIPNIPAFIGWGLLTALFIPTGWYPNAHLAKISEPCLMILLPLLVGLTGGRAVYGARGAVVGAFATMGVIVGSSIPMFPGAMIMGPLGGLLTRELDILLLPRTRKGFEALVSNFSAGILGLLLMLVGYALVGGVVESATSTFADWAKRMTEVGLLPLAALVIEPAKVLFVNNAIGQGVLTPLGLLEAQQYGKSVYFLLESNPGPGLGLLTAYMVFGRGPARSSAPGALIIHFFGGIHELYFPYVLMNPLTVLAVIAGGLAGNSVFVATDAGLIAIALPGSIFAEIAMSPRGGLIPVLLGIICAAAVSFVVATPFVRRAKQSLGLQRGESERDQVAHHVKKVVFVCASATESAATGQSMLARKLRNAGLKADIKEVAFAELTGSADFVVISEALAARAREVVPDGEVFAVKDFADSAALDAIVAALAAPKPHV